MSTVLAFVTDPSTTSAIRADLSDSDVRLLVTTDASTLLATAVRERVSALVVDANAVGGVGLPDLGSVRSDFRTAALPLVVLTARSMPVDDLETLGSPADDYLPAPFAAGDLRRRLAWVMRRAADLSPMSSLTGLPGQVAARQALTRRMEHDEPFAYCRLDLDEFRAFNEVYGHARGDQLILALASALRRVAAELAPQPFVGHVGGDDFVLLCTPQQSRPACRDVADVFATDALELYDAADAERGALRLTDRRGTVRDVPLLTVSTGVATNEQRRFCDHHQVAAVAYEMLRFAKRTEGSSVAVDRRRA